MQGNVFSQSFEKLEVEGCNYRDAKEMQSLHPIPEQLQLIFVGKCFLQLFYNTGFIQHALLIICMELFPEVLLKVCCGSGIIPIIDGAVAVDLVLIKKVCQFNGQSNLTDRMFPVVLCDGRKCLLEFRLIQFFPDLPADFFGGDNG